MALDPRMMSRAQAADAHVDVGLRQYMLGVYNHMTIGLAITGLLALGASFLAIQGGQLTGFGYICFPIEMGDYVGPNWDGISFCC